MVAGEERRSSLKEIFGKGRQQEQGSGASPPFCTFELEAGLRQAGGLYLGGICLKSLTGALWNRNVKGN